jgi:hypothetical protein
MAAGVTNLRPRITHKHSSRKLYTKPLPRNAYLSGRMTSQLQVENVIVTFKRLSCEVKICNNLVKRALVTTAQQSTQVAGRGDDSWECTESTVVTADKK